MSRESLLRHRTQGCLERGEKGRKKKVDGQVNRRGQGSREGPTRPLRQDLAFHSTREVVYDQVTAGEASKGWPCHWPVTWGEAQEASRPFAALVASYGVHTAVGEIQQKVST